MRAFGPGLGLRTERLDLWAATPAILDAELESVAALSAVLGAEVPAGWPPGEYDHAAVRFFRERLAGDPAATGWLAWYAVARPVKGARAVLVASGGYFGPPGPEGEVEIGYSTAPGYEGLGYATEIARALTARALDSPGVCRVIAHVRPDNPGSIRVLERAGFAPAGPGREPGTTRYQRERPDP